MAGPATLWQLDGLIVGKAYCPGSRQARNVSGSVNRERHIAPRAGGRNGDVRRACHIYQYIHVIFTIYSSQDWFRHLTLTFQPCPQQSLSSWLLDSWLERGVICTWLRSSNLVLLLVNCVTSEKPFQLSFLRNLLGDYLTQSQILGHLGLGMKQGH